MSLDGVEEVEQRINGELLAVGNTIMDEEIKE